MGWMNGWGSIIDKEKRRKKCMHRTRTAKTREKSKGMHMVWRGDYELGRLQMDIEGGSKEVYRESVDGELFL